MPREEPADRHLALGIGHAVGDMGHQQRDDRAGEEPAPGAQRDQPGEARGEIAGDQAKAEQQHGEDRDPHLAQPVAERARHQLHQPVGQHEGGDEGGRLRHPARRNPPRPRAAAGPTCASRRRW